MTYTNCDIFRLGAVAFLLLASYSCRADVTDVTAMPPLLPGAFLQRTMTLLATSTPTHRNAVRVLFYGQSITKQVWSAAVGNYLKAAYPYADINVENRAIGGFASDLLIRTVDRDINTFYPDLVIFHDYGGEPNYELIVESVRRNTTAEMALCNDHFISGQPTEWHDHHSFVWLPQIAAEYGCEFIDIRTTWKQYLKDNSLQPDQLTIDGTHLNDRGNVLMASLVEEHLKYLPGYQTSSWKGLTSTYHVGKDVRWFGGKLVLPFTGNRIDLISSNKSDRLGQPAQILIDGQPASHIPGLYSYTRPNDEPGADWPWTNGGIIHITFRTLPLIEDWTATIDSVDLQSNSFTFHVVGSKTGKDGAGSSSEEFISNSGRVVIEPQDWWIKGPKQNILISPGYQFTWSVLPEFAETYLAPVANDPTRETTTTIGQGLPNTQHILTIVCKKPVAISAIRVYQPPLVSSGD